MITISNERLEELANGDMEVWYSESQSMARELLALRKERERAEPVAYLSKADVDAGYPHILARKEYSKACPMAVYTAPPEPSFSDDSLPYDPQSAEHEQMMEAEQAQADTTSQQFESLAGKAVGGSDGFECTPVADLYELLTKCGECYDYTTSAKVAADWIKEGYSAREYVKLDRLQEAMTQGSAGEGDGWIPCNERMPEVGDIVLTADNGCVNVGEMERSGASCRYFTSVVSGRELPATHWQPLPEPPCK
ncbi:DUF551 domain-containing protein [Cronobacter sakazakii]|nr:DUF551 domain-containing protein [Cronobacter sakazakii]